MDKGKLIPIVIIVLLCIFSVGIFFVNKNNNKSLYSKLIVNYQDEDIVYDELTVDKKFTIENVNFYVSAVQKDMIVLTTDSYVTVNLKNTSEFQIDVDKFANVCFSSGNCADFRLA